MRAVDLRLIELPSARKSTIDIAPAPLATPSTETPDPIREADRILSEVPRARKSIIDIFAPKRAWLRRERLLPR
jgi:hypothetical protein